MSAASQTSPSSKSPSVAAAAPWLPLLVIVLAQLQMGINVNALPVSLGPISDDLNTPATAVATALVLYSLFVAAFVMLGAKIGKMVGELRIFQLGVLVHGVAMVMMAVSTDASTMNIAQGVAGIAAAALVPTLVVLIAANYRDRQQETALGVLAGVPAIASGAAFLIAGFIATVLSWRYSFGLIAFLSIVVFILSFRLNPIPRKKGVRIDLIGVVLSALAIAAILFGFNNMNSWGPVLAKEAAPFDLLRLSPAPFLILIGVLLGQAFFAWSNRRVEKKKAPLLAMEVLDSPEERNAVIAFLVAGGLGPAVSFLVPLYIQVVQDRTPLFSAVAIVPYALSIAAAAILSVRLYPHFSPRKLGVASFILVAAGLAIVAFTVSNSWNSVAGIGGLLMIGVGEGTLLTLLFNVLVSASPKELAGDVGALRGVANNVSSALGSAFAGVVAVGLLGVMVATSLNSADLPVELTSAVSMDKVDFVSNKQLTEVLSVTGAPEADVQEAVRINEDARLRALKASLLILSGIALLAIFPASRLPNYVPEELSADDILNAETT